MFIARRFGCCALTFLLAAAAASAQQPPVPASSQSGPTTIALDVVVTQKSGPPISGLTQQDFTLLDNKAPQTIVSFKEFSARQAPVQILLVIDAVNATALNVGFMREQIDKFLQSEGGNLAYPVAIDVLGDKGIQTLADFSTNGNALSAALQKDDIGLRSITRSAGYWGATERLDLSLSALNQVVSEEAKLPGRKLILWLSPGWPLLNAPGIQFDSKAQAQAFTSVVHFTDQLWQSGVTLYSIDTLGAGESTLRASDYDEFLKPVSKPGQAQIGDLGLQILALHSGGLALAAGNDIGRFIEQCVADAAPYYEISYAPPPSDGPNEYHNVQIKLDKPGLTARTRQGYYAQPSAAPR
jgi:VWFA-related protein